MAKKSTNPGKRDETPNGREGRWDLDWRSIGVGVVLGALLLYMVIAAGGRLEKVNVLGLELAFSTPVNVPVAGPNNLVVDNLPFSLIGYGLGNDFVQPQHFSRLSVVSEADSLKSYKLDFSMPLQGDAAAGISFMLTDPIDLTDYSHIELGARFTNSQCDLFLKDVSNAGTFVTLSEQAPTHIRTDLVDGKWQFKIDLSNFTGINLQAVKQIGCNAHRCEGACAFELGKIEFRKP